MKSLVGLLVMASAAVISACRHSYGFVKQNAILVVNCKTSVYNSVVIANNPSRVADTRQMFSENLALPLALMGGNGGGNNFLNAMLMGPMMSSDAGPAMMMAMQSQNQKHSATNVQPAAAQKTQSQGFSPMLLALASGSSDTMKRLAPFLMMQQNMV